MPLLRTKYRRDENGNEEKLDPLTGEWNQVSAGEIDNRRENFQAMLDSRKAPGGQGTDVFFTGMQSRNPFPDMPESMRQHYIKQCREQGISFEGKRYMSGLVRQGYGGRWMDPQALVDSTHDVKAVVESRGWSCSGMTNVDAREIECDDPLSKPYRVAPSIVQERINRRIEENPELANDKRAIADLRETLTEKMSQAL